MENVTIIDHGTDTPVGAWVVGSLILFFCVLVIFVTCLRYCKCKCFHFIWLRWCPGDYTRVDLEELSEDQNSQDAHK